MTGAVVPACIGRTRKKEAAMMRSMLVCSLCASAFANASFIGLFLVVFDAVTTFTYIWSHHTPLVFSVKKARLFSV